MFHVTLANVMIRHYHGKKALAIGAATVGIGNIIYDLQKSFQDVYAPL